MYPKEHSPPHFHAKYNEFEIIIAIKDFAILEGKLPPRALSFVIEWAFQHQDELMKNWQNMLDQKPFEKIEPLN